MNIEVHLLVICVLYITTWSLIDVISASIARNVETFRGKSAPVSHSVTIRASTIQIESPFQNFLFSCFRGGRGGVRMANLTLYIFMRSAYS